MLARAAESCGRRYSREEFQGHARVRRRESQSGSLLSKGRSVHRRDPLCKSAASGAHLNHVGLALKAIRNHPRVRRSFNERDRVTWPPVVVVSTTMLYRARYTVFTTDNILLRHLNDKDRRRARNGRLLSSIGS